MSIDMDEIAPLIALQFKVANSIDVGSGFSTCVDTGMELIMNTRRLFREQSTPKLPSGPSRKCGVVKVEHSRDKSSVREDDVLAMRSRKCESRMMFSGTIEGKVEGDCGPTTISRCESARHTRNGFCVENVVLERNPEQVLSSSRAQKIALEIVDDLASTRLTDKIVTENEPKNTPSTLLLEASKESKVDKEIFRKNFQPLWGSTSIRGRRSEMEDFAVALPHFLDIPFWMLRNTVKSSQICPDSTGHVFGVYDGHGGCQVANYCRERLHLSLPEDINNVANDRLHVETGDGNLKDQWLKIFKKCFRRIDDEVGGFRLVDKSIVSNLSYQPIAPESCGSTAVVAILCSTHIIVANCGDSRAILCRGKVPVPLSVDHKPSREDECARIEASGGKVINWDGYRVSGVLAMSRSIGDRYLRPYVISDPEVMLVPRTKEDECLILASDGLWDVLSNKEACDMARKRILLWHKMYGATLSKERGNGADPAAQDAADFLSQVAFQRGSQDNISVIVVDLKSNRKFKKT
ncbi:protein phosphatase 2C 50-like [Andrographis paniculata]|uniref:protein phosphatase 2C 50-like n=1 Tax=Andrographis paniculata TaxID=175694 RepID=UPI0021E759D7|nr:protein phosphatase 2C 50-like [Andrographis paniculata]